MIRRGPEGYRRGHCLRTGFWEGFDLHAATTDETRVCQGGAGYGYPRGNGDRRSG